MRPSGQEIRDDLPALCTPPLSSRFPRSAAPAAIDCSTRALGASVARSTAVTGVGERPVGRACGRLAGGISRAPKADSTTVIEIVRSGLAEVA